MAWGMRNIVISLFGSSIMEGRIGANEFSERYYAILQKKLSEAFPEVCFAVINGGQGGWTTRELMGVFEQDVQRYSPDYCLVMMGANNHDIKFPERSLRPGEFEELMESFERRLDKKTQRIGVVLNPIIDRYHFTFDSPDWQKFLQPYGGLDRLTEIERELARKFYRKYDYPVIDLAKMMESDPEKYVSASDGIHLTPAGHQLFAEAAFETLKPLLIANGHHTNGRE